MAQLVNAGCAALSYYTGMLFRPSVFILIASCVLIAGCGAPRNRDAAASRRSSSRDLALNKPSADASDAADFSTNNFNSELLLPRRKPRNDFRKAYAAFRTSFLPPSLIN